MTARLSLNPFFWLILLFGVVLLLYPLGYSALYEPLCEELLLFLLLVLSLSVLFGALYLRLPEKGEEERRPLPVKETLFFLSAGYAIEFCYAGHIPLAEELLGSSYTYMDFRGIPTFHVLLVTFSLYFAVRLFSEFLGAGKAERRSLFWALVFLFFLMATLYNRGLMLMAGFSCGCLFLAKGKRGKLLLLPAGGAALYLFGLFGNLRSGSAWNDISYLSEVAKLDLSGYPAFLPKEFLWSYVYFVSPLGNLNHYLIHGSAEPNLNKLFLCVLPDALTKRLGFSREIPLVTPYLNVSTGFAAAFRYGSYGGMLFFFLALSAFLFLVGRLGRGLPEVQAILCCVAALTFFTDMLTFTGLTFALVYPFLFRTGPKRLRTGGEKLALYAVTHKEAALPEGRTALGVGGKRIAGVELYDDTGDNISRKNFCYCELTALYWIRKNTQDGVVGLEHYRRFFSEGLFPARKERLLYLLRGRDVLLPYPTRLPCTVKEQYARVHDEKDLLLCREAVGELFPDYLPAFDRAMERRSLYACNMFVMRRELLEGYCDWLFPILFKTEEKTDLSTKDGYQRRVFGFLAERLFNVWLIRNHPRVRRLFVRGEGSVHFYRGKITPLIRAVQRRK